MTYLFYNNPNIFAKETTPPRVRVYSGYTSSAERLGALETRNPT